MIDAHINQGEHDNLISNDMSVSHSRFFQIKFIATHGNGFTQCNMPFTEAHFFHFS